MTNKGIDIKHAKLRGEWAELRFMARAAELGLRVSKPFGDSARYDVAVEHDGQFLRVQVKSTKCKERHRRASYACDLRRRGSQPYSDDQVDFFAIYVVPCDAWYIFPVEVALRARSNLILSPDFADSKYAPYQEAWHLLSGKKAKRRAASAPAAATSEASACAKEGDCDQSEDNAGSPDDVPPSPIESRLGAIRWNPILSHWKPRR